MYKKAAVVVPVFTASLVSSKDPSKDDLSNKEKAPETKNQNPKPPKKQEIIFGDPKIQDLQITRQSRSRVKKSRSTLSIFRLKSSYLRLRLLKSRYLRLCVSKSPDSRYFTSRSPSVSPSTSYSNSPGTVSPCTGSTYTLSDMKSVHTTPSGVRSPNSVSVCLSMASCGSTSPFSVSPASRPTYSTSHFYHTRSPVSKKHCRLISKLPVSKPCLKQPTSKCHRSRSPSSKPCLKPTAKTPGSVSPASKPSCLKSRLKSSQSRSPVPKKSCLRSPASKSPNSSNRPSCIRTPTSNSLNSKPSPVKRSCLKSPVLSSPSKKSPESIQRCSRLESAAKSPKRITPALRSSTASPQPRTPNSKSPCLKSVSFKSADSKSLKSRSPTSVYSQPRTPKSNSACTKTTNLKTDSRSVQSKTPQRVPGSAVRSLPKSPSAKPAITNTHRSSPPLKLTDSKSQAPRSPPSKQARTPDIRPVLKPDLKRRPTLAVSKIHVSRLSVKRSKGLRPTLVSLKTCDRSGRPSRSLVKLTDYRSVDLESRLVRQPKKDLNREYLEKLLSTKMDVRYMVELKNYFDRIKLICTPQTCGEMGCDVLQERMRIHREQHHGGQPPTERQKETTGDTKGSEAQTKITLADLGGFSIDLEARPTSTNSYGVNAGGPNYQGGPGYQGGPASKGGPGSLVVPGSKGGPGSKVGPGSRGGSGYQGDNGHEGGLNKVDFDFQGGLNSKAGPDDERSLGEKGNGSDRNARKRRATAYPRGPIYKDESDYEESGTVVLDTGSELKPKFNNKKYRAEVETEVRDWIKSVPIQDVTADDMDRKESVVQDLIDKISSVGHITNNSEAEMLKKEIFQNVSNLKIWHTGSNRDLENLKEGLSENLFERILKINDSMVEGGPSDKGTAGFEKGPSNRQDSSYRQGADYGNKASYGQGSGGITVEERDNLKNIQRGNNMKNSLTETYENNRSCDLNLNKGPNLSNDKTNVDYDQLRHPSYAMNRNLNSIITDLSNIRKEERIKSATLKNNSYNDNHQNSNQYTNDPYYRQNDSNMRGNCNYLANSRDYVIGDPKYNADMSQMEPNARPSHDTIYGLSYENNTDNCAPDGICRPQKRSSHYRPKTCHDPNFPPSCEYPIKKLNLNSCCSDPALKYTVFSKNICGCPTVKNVVKHKPSCGLKSNSVKRELTDWMKKCTFIKCNGLINRQEIIDALLFYINPYLNQSSKTLNKAVLKAKIINVLRGLGLCGYASGGMKMALNKQADDLANRLIGIVTRLECTRNTSWNCCVRANRPFRYVEQVYVGPNQVIREDLKHDLMQEFEYFLRELNQGYTADVLEDITELIIDKIELIRRDIDEVVRNDIREILDINYVLTDEELTNTVNNIIKSAREIVMMIMSLNDRTNPVTAETCLSGTLSIYTSEHETPSFIAAGTSSPKKKKEVSKQSPEEKAYVDEITAVVKEWIRTKPDHFENLNDKKMNEVMILDLVGEIVDHVKLGQLITDTSIDTKSIMTYYVFKWLIKFEVVDVIEQAEPYAQELVKKMQAISVPQMTRPQHGTRQTIKNIKHLETKDGWNETFVPKAKDILEDEISIWMNEYPSDIYVDKDKSAKNKFVHEFAENMADKKSDKDVSKYIKTWLNKIVKPKEKERIESMSDSLRERISKLPQDQEIAAKREERLQNKRELAESIPESFSQDDQTQEESDNTMKEFIIKYVEHNYDEDDPLAKAAYVKLLKLELQRLSPQVLQEVYKGQPLEKFSPEKLRRELEYIKDISDWLKTLPVDSNYNKPGNKCRIEFIISLAREIAHVEEERRQSPDAMNYDEFLGTIICEYMHQLPLKVQIGDSITKYVHPMLIKIFKKREENKRPLPHQAWIDIADFLDDYVRLNGQDIADDELKLEVWATRLLQEIKKMIAENPSSLPEATVLGRLAEVTKPGDETIKRFNHELDYATEITDWLKNFPLVSNVDEEMIKDLAERMAESETETDNRELVNYIEQWISKLPLNKNKQIDVPFVIQQLLNRRNKVMKEKEPTVLPKIASKASGSSGITNSRDGGSVKSLCRGCCPVDDPGQIIVQVIKDWCDDIPLQGTDADIRHARDDIASKLYQKVIEINDDPRLARKDMPYLETLSDRVDELMNNLPRNIKLEDDKNKIKDELLKKIQQARLFTKEVGLGDEYIKDLEDAVERTLPKPAQTGGTDPGFEMYKENLTEMFILENFDHGNDADKLKYKKKIKDKIDEFALYAQQRKSVPVPADKLLNDTLATLFNINMPVEKAMVDNVEEIKTKGEIDDWVASLPLRSVGGLDEQLERDQRVRLLARKLHILEFEKDPDQKIHKEITKWLAHSPLLPGEEANIDRFANDLQDILKRTKKSRKCVKASDVVLPESDEGNSIWVNPNITIDPNSAPKPTRLKTGDIMLDIVEKWSDNIPLPPNLPKEETQKMRDDVTIQIIKKISELNSGRNTFDDDKLYNHLMNLTIEKALAGLPQTDTLIQSKGALAHQLISAIESVKPLIREDRARHEYKTELENTVGSFLGTLKNATPEEQALFNKIQEEIVDDFLEHQYNKDDEEGQEFYKNKMLNALTKYNYIGENDENREEIISDTLVESNRLLCELKKIAPPENLPLRDEVEEIRMKQEVDNFLNKASPTSKIANSIRRNSLRNSLVKQLHELEKKGHTDENNKKMAAAVSRTLKKINPEAKDEHIQPFIDRLQKNEPERKAPPFNKHADGNSSLPTYLHGREYPDFQGPLSLSVPVSPDMYDSEYVKSFGPRTVGPPAPPTVPNMYDSEYVSNFGPRTVGPSVPQAALPPSPSKARKLLMDYPPTDSVSFDSPQGGPLEVAVSFHRPDYVPPNWVPPTPPPAIPTFPDQDVEFLPRMSVPPRSVLPTGSSLSPGSVVPPDSIIPPGSLRSVEVPQQTLTQLTQTPALIPGATQTTLPSGTPYRLQVPQAYGQGGIYGRPPSRNYGQPLGNFGQPSPGNFGQPQPGNYAQPQPGNYTRPQASAGVQSGPGYVPGGIQLTGDECLCDMCNKNPCEFIDYYDSCDELVPMFRRHMMMPPCLMMPPPPFMY